MKLHSLHIQTIESCNSHCVMCPNSYKRLSDKVIEDWVFIKIIRETLPYMLRNADYNLFLQNEPLLDKFIHKRAEFIKKINPNSNIYISTNGILLPKFKNKLQYFDRILVSIYGHNVEDYNKITRSQISKKTFDEFMEVIKEHDNVEENLKFSSEWNSYNDILSSFTSRAGFLSDNKIIHKTSNIKCKKKRYENWLNFLADGTLILCCMDYNKEAVLGNIKHQSLKEIFESKLFKTITLKAAGKIKSEKDFICKKCEQNLEQDFA